MSIIGVQISHALNHPQDAEFCGMCDPARWIVDAEVIERTRAIIREDAAKDVYVYVTEEPVAHARSLSADVLIDYDADDKVRGVEVLGAAKVETS